MYSLLCSFFRYTLPQNIKIRKGNAAIFFDEKRLISLDSLSVTRSLDLARGWKSSDFFLGKSESINFFLVVDNSFRQRVTW